MSNMSYCRFQNTARDLDDCKDALEAIAVGDAPKLSHDELRAAMELVQTAFNIVLLVAEHNAIDLEEDGALDDFERHIDDAVTELNSNGEDA